MLCAACLEERGEGDTYALATCGCTHCRRCLVSYIEARIEAADVAPACFLEPPALRLPCAVPLGDDDLRQLLADGLWRRFERMRLLRNEPLVRFCPRCDRVHRGGSQTVRALTCQGCSMQFCFSHASAHAPGAAACAAYELEHASEMRDAEAALRAEGAKRCPNTACGAFIIRGDGCNAVVCTRCGTTWCWLCGASLPPGVELPLHYSFFNIWGCPNQQFSGRAPARGMEQVLTAVGTLLYTLFFGLPAFIVIASLCLLFSCCCVPLARAQVGGPRVYFGTLVSVAAHIWSLVVLALLAAPIILPIVFLFSIASAIRAIIRLCGCCGPTAAASAAAAGSATGTGAGTDAGTPPHRDDIIVIAHDDASVGGETPETPQTPQTPDGSEPGEGTPPRLPAGS